MKKVTTEKLLSVNVEIFSTTENGFLKKEKK
jgi:hypothetical protein